MVVVLHNIRSALNVGSIFRTADGAGIKKIYLCGFTPEPINQFGDMKNDFKKTALGAEKNVDWEKRKTTWRLIEELKGEGYDIFAIEQDKRSIPYNKVKVRKKKTALVLGDELRGVPKSVLDRADKILEIPMLGIKESLNVSVAFGVVAFHLRYRA